MTCGSYFNTVAGILKQAYQNNEKKTMSKLAQYF